jgi:hypothetical protein
MQQDAHLKIKLLFHPEDGDSMYLQSVGIYQPTRRKIPEYSALLIPKLREYQK